MDNTLSSMRTTRVSIYNTAEWSSRVARVATISVAGDGTYAVDWMPVVTMNATGLFTVLTCVDETKHVVLTAFLRLVHSEQHSAEGQADAPH